MAKWEEKMKEGQPDWTVVQPVVEDISNGGQKYLPLKDSSFLAQGYAPTKHTVKMTTKTDLQNITAFRLELLNDPNLPLGGPGRSIKGTAALTEFEVEVAPADAPDKTTQVKIAKATADINLPEAPLDAILRQDRHRGGDWARRFGLMQWRNSLGTDAGRARNQPRKPSLRPKPRLPISGRCHVSSQPTARRLEYDDNQSQQSARFRLSITTNPGSRPAAPERAGDFSHSSGTSEHQQFRPFSVLGTTVPNGNKRMPNRGVVAAVPGGSAQLVLRAREEIADHILLGDFQTDRL
jgi:hypothetical protein